MMSNTDINFVAGVVEEVKRSEKPFSRDVLSDCYFKDLQQRGINEQLVVSEKWIDYYWKRFSSVPFDVLERASTSTPKLAKLLVELLGK